MTEINCWDDTVEVVKIMGTRHSVKFPEDDRPSIVLFCNECAYGFVYENEETGYAVCAKCGVEQHK